MCHSFIIENFVSEYIIYITIKEAIKLRMSWVEHGKSCTGEERLEMMYKCTIYV